MSVLVGLADSRINAVKDAEVSKEAWVVFHVSTAQSSLTLARGGRPESVR